MLATEFKTSAARLARLFRRSRDTWKRRAAEKQHALKKLRITVRDLTDSRTHWKAIAHQQSGQLAALRAELAQVRQESPVGGP